jgi:hypothetical protein
MKKLIVLLAIVSLNGCAVYDAYMMTGFDPNEYRIITEIRTDAYIYKQQCDNKMMAEANAILIADKTQLFQFYEEQIPTNSNGVNASKELNKIAQGLRTRYKEGTSVPTLFCKLKLESIEHSAETIQHVLGKRPR